MSLLRELPPSLGTSTAKPDEPQPDTKILVAVQSVYVDPLPPTIRLDDCNFSDVRSFTCGRANQKEERWERDVSEWIKDPGPSGALYADRMGEAEVYLYYEGNHLIGYGSIGVETWKDIENGEVIGRVSVLPYAGIHTNFRGQGGPPERRYGRRILGGLIEEVDRRAANPWLFLYVDPENPARNLYPLFGFEVYDEWPDDTGNGRIWLRMRRRVPTYRS
jgi:ribosomal protein S18 acetylase RimI-like enzyme